LHVSIHLSDDFGVGHVVDLVLEISSTNVPDDQSLLASGVLPARAAGSAGSMTEVPKGQRFGRSARWDFSFKHESCRQQRKC
jgi:hypothetical protein